MKSVFLFHETIEKLNSRENMSILNLHTVFLRFSGELTCGGPWISLFHEAVLPPKGSEARDAMEADMEPGK